MKRLVSLLLTAMLLFAPATALAKSTKTKTLNVKTIVGMTENKLVSKYGNPARKDDSEYGFKWYVYNKDYKNFFMAGVKNGKVVAAYSNAAGQRYGGKIKLNTSRTTVRRLLGKPVTHIQKGNTIYLLNNTNDRDFFAVGRNYVIVFYDSLKSYKTTAIMVVPKAGEDGALLNKPKLSGKMQTAYRKQSVDLVNAIRVRNGKKALKSNSELTSLAKSRSTDMRDRNYFSHYTPDKKRLNAFDIAREKGIKFTSMGENIAYGNHSAVFAHESFLNSSGHRNSLLRSTYTKIGAAVACGGSRYVILTNIYSR